MQIHRIRGVDLTDALKRARRTYGEGAVVVSQEAAPGGGVMLAVTERAPLQADEMAALREQGDRSLGKVRPMNFPRENALSPGFEEVRQRLLSTGCSEEWSARICERASSAAEAGDHPMDTVGATIAQDVRIASLPKAPGVTRVITFVGNTGVGKTTGLVKLGARLVRARRKIGLATLDSKRVGAVEQFRAYADLLGAPLRALNMEEILSPEALGAIGNDVILLDTTGRPAADQPRLVQFHEAMKQGDRSTRLDAFLVLPATSSREALLEVSEAYGDVPMAGCVITKLDETRKPSPVLEHVVDMGLPVAFMSNGQDIGRHFQRATPELLADLVLLGRIQ